MNSYLNEQISSEISTQELLRLIKPLLDDTSDKTDLLLSLLDRLILSYDDEQGIREIMIIIEKYGSQNEIISNKILEVIDLVELPLLIIERCSSILINNSDNVKRIALGDVCVLWKIVLECCEDLHYFDSIQLLRRETLSYENTVIVDIVDGIYDIFLYNSKIRSFYLSNIQKDICLFCPMDVYICILLCTEQSIQEKMKKCLLTLSHHPSITSSLLSKLLQLFHLYHQENSIPIQFLFSFFLSIHESLLNLSSNSNSISMHTKDELLRFISEEAYIELFHLSTHKQNLLSICISTFISPTLSPSLQTILGTLLLSLFNYTYALNNHGNNNKDSSTILSIPNSYDYLLEPLQLSINNIYFLSFPILYVLCACLTSPTTISTANNTSISLYILLQKLITSPSLPLHNNTQSLLPYCLAIFYLLQPSVSHEEQKSILLYIQKKINKEYNLQYLYTVYLLLFLFHHTPGASSFIYIQDFIYTHITLLCAKRINLSINIHSCIPSLNLYSSIQNILSIYNHIYNKETINDHIYQLYYLSYQESHDNKLFSCFFTDYIHYYSALFVNIYLYLVNKNDLFFDTTLFLLQQLFIQSSNNISSLFLQLVDLLYISYKQALSIVKQLKTNLSSLQYEDLFSLLPRKSMPIYSFISICPSMTHQYDQNTILSLLLTVLDNYQINIDTIDIEKDISLNILGDILYYIHLNPNVSILPLFLSTPLASHLYTYMHYLSQYISSQNTQSLQTSHSIYIYTLLHHLYSLLDSMIHIAITSRRSLEEFLHIFYNESCQTDCVDQLLSDLVKSLSFSSSSSFSLLLLDIYHTIHPLSSSPAKNPSFPTLLLPLLQNTYIISLPLFVPELSDYINTSDNKIISLINHSISSPLPSVASTLLVLYIYVSSLPEKDLFQFLNTFLTTLTEYDAYVRHSTLDTNDEERKKRKIVRIPKTLYIPIYKCIDSYSYITYIQCYPNVLLLLLSIVSLSYDTNTYIFPSILSLFKQYIQSFFPSSLSFTQYITISQILIHLLSNHIHQMITTAFTPKETQSIPLSETLSQNTIPSSPSTNSKHLRHILHDYICSILQLFTFISQSISSYRQTMTFSNSSVPKLLQSITILTQSLYDFAALYEIQLDDNSD
ncbi:hypothetical protein WA158_001626 [Blastocystis sp. Blastoise]